MTIHPCRSPPTQNGGCAGAHTIPPPPCRGCLWQTVGIHDCRGCLWQTMGTRDLSCGTASLACAPERTFLRNEYFNCSLVYHCSNQLMDHTAHQRSLPELVTLPQCAIPSGGWSHQSRPYSGQHLMHILHRWGWEIDLQEYS